uniref:Uncharacterized protein n=1 Tax=Glossina palpalis gambiensis TaxID=67801 RepID=A0A1B0B3S9_9MUSC
MQFKRIRSKNPIVDCTPYWNPGKDRDNGHYIKHEGSAPNDVCFSSKHIDPCAKSGPTGAGYYLLWNHGRLSDQRDLKPWNETLKCFQQILYIRDGYYMSFPDDKSLKDGCVLNPPKGKRGYYIWHHGELPQRMYSH